MKILLIRPKPDKETIGLQHVMVCEPLELEYLVSNIPEELKSKVDIKIFDFILENRSYEDVIREEKPDLIGFTGYISHVGVIKNLAKISKEVLENVYTAVGGVHAEVVGQDFVSPYIDFVYDRNGIDMFNSTLLAIYEGKGLDEIKGILKEAAAKKDTFNYAFPDREAVSKYRDKYYYMFHKPCALIKTSYGCPFNCSFCFCKEITNGKYFKREIEDVIEELQTIEEEEIYIVDDDFLFDANRIVEFIGLIKKYNINKKYLIYGRADFIAKNEELLKSLKAVGLQAVIVGIESVRESDLKSYNKGTSIEINEKAIKILRTYDIELYATLIIPLDFSKNDFNTMVKWLIENKVRFVNLQPLTPLPGTNIYSEYTDDLIVDRKEYEKWDMAHVILQPEHMSIRSFYFQMIKSYYRIIMRPKNVWALIKKYGLKDNIRMLAGSNHVSLQYIMKVIKG
ncbi:MAG: B12-binding domain-containing radical SAM protein [Gudongella sp.]|jgi:radical SAM superfamily enzyme YgiQ (UPF0313 family)|nr:B12-binding domain-containing radical SAM protein [Gudongella sp.]